MRAKISHVNFITASLIFVLSFALLFFPSDANAYDLTSPSMQAVGIATPNQVYYCTDASLPNITYWMNPGGFCYGSSTKRWARTGLSRIEAGGSTNNWAVAGIRIAGVNPEVVYGIHNKIPAGTYISFPFYVSSNQQALNFITQVGVIPRPGQEHYGSFRLVDVVFDNYDAGGYRMNIVIYITEEISNNSYFEFMTDATDSTTASGSNPFSPNFWWSRGISTAGIVAGSGVAYQVVQSSGSSGYDDEYLLTLLHAMYDKLDEISDNSVNATALEILDAVEAANDDANDRYQDEKDTINDSRDEAQDSADSMDTSGFTFGNPLATWFGMFSNNQCVSIPKLKAWLHGTENQVCSPWSSDVRSNLTPVASILSIMVAFGLLIHWLKGDSDVGLENT